MRHLITILAALATSSGTGHAQTAPAIAWQYNYGGSMPDAGYDISRTSDGGYIIAGITQSSDGDVIGHQGLRDIWLVKLQADGAMEWQRCYGGSADDGSRCVVRETADGGVILSGTTYSTDGDVECTVPIGQKAWVVKTDALGSIVWQRCLGGSGTDGLHSIAPVDGGYVLSGSTSSPDGDAIGNHGLADAWVVKLDAEGSTLWSRCYGGSHIDAARSVAATSDGGCIVIGHTQSNDGDLMGINPYHAPPAPSHTGWILKLDEHGAIQWQRCYGGSGNDYLNDVRVAPDGTFWVAGVTTSNNGDVSGHHGNNDGWVLRLAANGDLIGQRCLGGSDWDQLNGLDLLPNGHALVTGYTRSTDGDVTDPLGASDAWVSQLDPDLNIVWQRNYGGSAHDQGSSIRVTPDGGAVFTGSSHSNDGDLTGNNGGSDLWVVKLAPWDGTGLHDAAANGALQVYPNPAADVLHVQLEQGNHGPFAWEVRDMLGRVAMQDQGARDHITVPTGGLATGSYLFLLRTNNGPVARQFVKQ